MTLLRVTLLACLLALGCSPKGGGTPASPPSAAPASEPTRAPATEPTPAPADAPREREGLGLCCSAEGQECSAILVYRGIDALVTACHETGKHPMFWCPSNCHWKAPTLCECPGPPRRPAQPPADAAMIEFVGAPPGFVVTCTRCPESGRSYSPDAFPSIPMEGKDSVALHLIYKAMGYRTAEVSTTVHPGWNRVVIAMEPL